MAASELKITLTWENGVEFKMTAKRDDGDTLKVVQMDENGHIAQLWPSVQQLCETYLNNELEAIGHEMKATS